jgi:hypothetical protein
MVATKLFVFLVAIFWSQSCTSRDTPRPDSPRPDMQVNENRATEERKVDYKTFILGKWEGAWEDRVVMYFTFNKDGTAIVDYTPRGDKKTVRKYKFKNEKTLIMDGYPENIIIDSRGENEMRLRPEVDNEIDVNMIFVYSFKRIVE